MIMFLCIEYTPSVITALILVPTLSVLLVLFTLILVCSRRRDIGLVSARLRLNKAMAIIDGRGDGLTPRQARRIAAHILDAQYTADVPGEEHDLSPFLGALTEAHGLAVALADAGRSDPEVVEAIREKIDMAQRYLIEKCGVDRNISGNFRIASRAQRRADADRTLDEFLDKNKR